MFFLFWFFAQWEFGCLKQQNSGLLCFRATPNFSNICCNWVSLPHFPLSFCCVPRQLLPCSGNAVLLLPFLRSVSLCHLSAPPKPYLLAIHLPLWWTISYFLFILVLILQISNYNSHLLAHLCPLVYLPLPPSTHREIYTWALLTPKLTHFKIGWKECPSVKWKKKMQFVADTEPNLAACLASFSCQLCTG